MLTTRLYPAAIFLAATATAQSSIAWDSELPVVLEVAKAEHRVIVIAMLGDTHRSSAVFTKIHYRNSSLVKLSRNTINLVFTRGKGSDLEQDIRDRFFPNSTGTVAFPQHLFLSPTGEILFSVGGEMTAGQLEWAWAEAIGKVDKEFLWKSSDAMRAPGPEKIRQSKVADNSGHAAPTKKSLEKLMRDLRISKRSWLNTRDGRLDDVLRSDSPTAQKFASWAIRMGQEDDRARICRRIGELSPPSWSKFLTQFLQDSSEDVRANVVRSLGTLRNAQSFSTVKARWKRDASEKVRSRALLAMAQLAPRETFVCRTIQDTLEKSDSFSLRLHAVIAALALEDRAAAHDALRTALVDQEPRIRSAAAWAIAHRRNRGLRLFLQTSLESEMNPDVRDCIKAAQDALEGGWPEKLKSSWPVMSTRGNDSAPEAPADLMAALKKVKEALATYESFSPSHQREYVQWIVTTRSEETRQRRIGLAVERMAEGKSRWWKQDR